MLEPKRGGYYRLVTGMLHPAVLGTVVVLSISRRTELLRLENLFAIAASLLLIWYFALDYLVTVIEFEKKPNSYTLIHFALEIVLMVLLLYSFDAAWSKEEGRHGYFFNLVGLQLLIIAAWNRFTDSKAGWSNKWVWVVAVVGLILLMLGSLMRWMGPDLRAFAQLFGLLFIAMLLVVYTVQFRKPGFFD